MLKFKFKGGLKYEETFRNGYKIRVNAGPFWDIFIKYKYTKSGYSGYSK
jgi:hypothetical protein